MVKSKSTKSIQFCFTKIVEWGAPVVASVATLCGATLAGSAPAHAHVKWFATFDVAAEPMPLSQVLTPVFWAALAFAALVLALISLVEDQKLGQWSHHIMNKLSGPFEGRMDDVMRAGTAVFFVCLWVIGGVYLTPELKTTSEWVPWLQFAIACSLFFKVTMPFATIGIFALWGLAVQQYGLFHMLDYPIFLATAVYFTLFACSNPYLREMRMPVLRWGAAITLMWASIEKFAYPHWTTPVLIAKPYLAAGFDADTFMTLAGVVEFGLAFALICSPLARRLGALALAVLFIAAVIPFGKIDAIGHLVIILILVTIIGERRQQDRTIFLTWARTSQLKFAALAGFFLCYYVGHAALFNHNNAGHSIALIGKANAAASAEICTHDHGDEVHGDHDHAHDEHAHDGHDHSDHVHPPGTKPHSH